MFSFGALCVCFALVCLAIHIVFLFALKLALMFWLNPMIYMYSLHSRSYSYIALGLYLVLMARIGCSSSTGAPFEEA